MDPRRVDFKRPDQTDVAALLERVSKAENKEISKEIIAEIVKRSNGDVRAALNDLEMMFDADPELIEYLGMRDRKSEIFKVLDRIFLSANFDVARNSLISSDVEIDMLINWVGQNIPNKYTSKFGISEAYENLSKASMFNEKASRKSYYGYLRYASILLSSGVSLSSTGICKHSEPVRISDYDKAAKQNQKGQGCNKRDSAKTHRIPSCKQEGYNKQPYPNNGDDNKPGNKQVWI